MVPSAREAPLGRDGNDARFSMTHKMCDAKVQLSGDPGTVPDAASIPFESQADTPGNQLCGAASLCMVYRSFGLACTQTEVWEQVSRRRGGSRRAQTYRLAADALRRGLAALIVQAREPWPVLRRCADAGVRVILNHRVRVEARDGHFSVLVAIDDEAAIVHDPMTGPDRRIAREELLQLWAPKVFRAEIAGNVLVAIHPDPPPAPPCPDCGTTLPLTEKCPICSEEVALRPACVLGCTSTTCKARLWSTVYCPGCDARMVFKHG